MYKKNLLLILIALFCFSTTYGNFPVKTTGIGTVDVKASTLKWTGYHLAKSYEHWGNISIKSGNLTVNSNGISGGEIVIDMKSITCGDVTDPDKNAKLVNHLKSEDFFDVKNNNTATIKIKKSSQSESGGKTIIADITIRGITKEISFEVFLDEETDRQLTYKATIMIERSAHQVMYGWSLENAMISGEFQIEALIVVSK